MSSVFPGGRAEIPTHLPSPPTTKLAVPEKPSQIPKTQRDNLKTTGSDGSRAVFSQVYRQGGKASPRGRRKFSEAAPGLSSVSPVPLDFPTKDCQ